MITITVKKRQGEYLSFVSKGHAGYAESGYDIVCSAVSALIITTVNSIEQFTDDKIQLEENDGFVSFTFIGKPSEKTQLLMDSLVLGLTQIEQSYSKRYLRLKVREV